MTNPDSTGQVPRREPSLRRPAIWSLAWLGAAALVGVAILVGRGSGDTGAYASAHLIERALSVYNVPAWASLAGAS
jgi:hypothetical protein